MAGKHDSGGTSKAPTRAQLGIETRSAPRGPASSVPSITGLRLSPHGGVCTLVNISATGLLADCGERVPTGSTVTVNFEGGFSPRSIQGKVTRSSVSSMAQGRLRYHVGIAFNERINIDHLPDAQKGEEAADAAADAAAAVPAVQAAPAPIDRAPAPQQAVNRW